MFLFETLYKKVFELQHGKKSSYNFNKSKKMYAYSNFKKMNYLRL